jgi:hypothetical protein
MDQAFDAFDNQFGALTGYKPFRWQRRLFASLAEEHVPAALDL